MPLPPRAKAPLRRQQEHAPERCRVRRAPARAPHRAHPPRSLRLIVQYAAAGDDLPARPLLRRWARAALAPGAAPAAVVLRFVDEAEGRALNRRHRRKDRPTNVLSFVYDDARGVAGGDIVLCAPVLRREAARQGKLLAAHCAHLVVHGMLHLQGYDHERAADAARMETREVAVLAGLGFADPYAAGEAHLPRPRRPRR